MRRAAGLWPGGVIVAAFGVAAPSSAQDIEMTAQITQRPLPAAYYERVRQQPDFFEIRDGWINRTARIARARQAVSDTLPLVVILALFSDSPEPQIANTDLQQELFDGPSQYGTVSEFYEEVSGGRFGVRGEVLPWVRTDLTMAETVGTSYGLGGDAQTGTYLVQALTAADTLIDFSQFDNDGLDGVPNSGDDDGTVDAVAFEFLEVSASCGGPAIWPHRSRISGWTGSPYVTNDVGAGGQPIEINDYIIQSVVTCDGASVQTATTIAHELAHVLGLPDLYDAADGILPEQRRWVIGCWSLMAAGSWGCGTASRDDWFRPTHMGPWEKDRLGWLSELEVVGEVLGQEFTLPSVIQSGRVLKVPLAGSEYLLVEYRKQEGFDVDLPAGGVLIYHIDPEMPIRPCQSCPKIYQVGLEEADGNRGLIRTFLQGGNRGEPGDAWGPSGPVRFTNTTTPSTERNSGAATGITFYSIAVEDSVARLVLSTRSIVLDRLLTSFLGSAEPPLIPEEEDYLDRVGNDNGRYDVGDLRAYRRR